MAAEPVRPFAHLASLPADVSEAFEAMKLCIVKHRLAGWVEIAQADMLAVLLMPCAAGPGRGGWLIRLESALCADGAGDRFVLHWSHRPWLSKVANAVAALVESRRGRRANVSCSNSAAMR